MQSLIMSAHGGHGGSGGVPAGEFKATPIITIEGHGGFENNLDGQPQHYAIDGQLGLFSNGVYQTTAVSQSKAHLAHL